MSVATVNIDQQRYSALQMCDLLATGILQDGDCVRLSAVVWKWNELMAALAQNRAGLQQCCRALSPI